MLNRHSQTWLSRTAIFLIVVLSLYASGAQAATLTSLSDTMSREKVSTASNHTIRFRTPTGVDAPADTITVDFPSFALGLVAFGDLDLTHGAVTGAETSEALAAAAAAGTWGVSIAGTTITLTSPTDAALGEITANDFVIVTVGTNAAGGVNQIMNPAASGAYTISIAGSFGDTGGIGVPILDDDQIAVTATVAATTTSSTPPVGPPPGSGPPQPTNPPLIFNVQATTTSPTTATITWQTDVSSNSTVDYGHTLSYASGTVSDATQVTSHTINLTGLIPCSTYHFKVTSADLLGNSASSGDGTFTMPCDTTPPVISNVQAVNITDTGVVITWTTDEPATSLVDYGTTVSYGSQATVPGLVTSHSVTINGLTPGTLYHFKVTSADASANSASSADFTFTTTQDVTPPANVTLTATAGDTQIQLTWTVPSDPDYAGVKIMRKTGGYPTGPNDGTPVYQGTGTQTLDTGLTNGTTYYYGAYAYDTNGNFASGALASATPTGPPVPPTPTPTAPPPIPPPPPIVPVTPGPGILPGPPSPGTTITVNLYGAGGTLPLAPGSNGQIGVLAGSNVLAVVPASSMNGTATIVAFTVAGNTYNLAYDAAYDSYRGSVPMPSAPGVYQATAQAIFTDGRTAEVTVTLDVQGGGIVVEATLIGAAPTVAGATVILFVDQGGWIPWNGAAYGEANPVFSNADGGYVFQVPPGRYYAEASKSGYEKAVTAPVYIDGNVFGVRIEMIKIPPPPEEVIQATTTPIANIIAVTQNLGEQVTYGLNLLRAFTQSPGVQGATKNVVAPAVLAVTLVNAASAISLFNLLAYLQYLFTQPILLLGRRKRKRWGIVYNSLTKVPVDLVIVRLVHHETGLTVQTRVTDKFGRFAFTAQPGTYRIEAVKPGYIFPSQYVKGATIDADYVDVYHAELIQATEISVLTPNVPIDPVVAEETPRQVLIRRTLRRLQHGVAFSGVVLAAVALLIAPSVPLALLVIVQIAIYLMFRRLNLPTKPKNWGIVSDGSTRQPLGRAIVRIFESKYNKLLETQLTDAAGRYAFLVRKNVYYVTAEAPGYRTLRLPAVDLTSSDEGVIARNIVLERGVPGAPTTPVPLSVPTPPEPPTPTVPVAPVTPPSSSPAVQAPELGLEAKQLLDRPK
ncbi:hypothetical protein A3E39_00570 [Candidatus Uhrbacteria bacterium RIFCSPHIGHO2_12_FULL_60_25]|uniref:Fibronectin type-III domain-containing protein n=1 Tax=Candidatus Uhrbacteria bacterium RIFCSPHIGHO2_12_FULL_60_25 TaxID=1802399 RepID=A0A1F7UJN0_9BACT|nr:MAG: hypothetical protein A3E39_00570 [Candidatus Uhrbacteria bacterium RIFCSPHIGHO2_12_FULL_60_25]